MGEVYRAHDKRLKRDVAIKILPDEFTRNDDRLNRFEREAQILASLNHTNIAAIHDLQELNGSRFLILELVEGDTLADILEKRGRLPVAAAMNIRLWNTRMYQQSADERRTYTFAGRRKPRFTGSIIGDPFEELGKPSSLAGVKELNVRSPMA
jgi:hypothetical protein